MAHDQASCLDRLFEQTPKRERRVQPGVEPETRGRLGHDEIRRQQDIAPVPQRRVVVADALVRAVATPEERDERARVGIDDPQARSFGAP